jgi:hypothetical protein
MEPHKRRPRPDVGWNAIEEERKTILLLLFCGF